MISSSFNIIVLTINNKKFKFRENISGREQHVIDEKLKNLLMKIARNGYYDYEILEPLKNPTYYPPTSILSVKAVKY